MQLKITCVSVWQLLGNCICFTDYTILKDKDGKTMTLTAKKRDGNCYCKDNQCCNYGKLKECSPSMEYKNVYYVKRKLQTIKILQKAKEETQCKHFVKIRSSTINKIWDTNLMCIVQLSSIYWQIMTDTWTWVNDLLEEKERLQVTVFR